MKSNTRFNKNFKGIECLNCKQPISNRDNFCSECGQVNDNKPLSIKQYITELLGGFFAFDTRTLNTLKPLLTKPGKVTKAYIEGERMKYVNPFQLYLHTSIIFFLITGVFMSIDGFNSQTNLGKKTEYSKQEKDSLGVVNTSSKKNGFSVNSLKLNLNPRLSFNTSYKKDITSINTLQQILKQSKNLTTNETVIKTVNDTILSALEKDKTINNLLDNKISFLYAKLELNDAFKKDSLYDYDKFKNVYLNNYQKEMDIKNIKETKFVTSSPWLEKYAHFINSKTKNVGKALDSLDYQRTRKNIFFYNKLQEFKNVTKGGAASKSFINKMISKSSLIMFFMLPLFTLFINLIYIRRKFNYTENLIFVFNVQTVFFILILIGIIFDRTFSTDIGGFSILVFLLYLYKAMRKFYNQGRYKTIIKLFILNFVYFVLSVFGGLTVAFLAFIM